MTGKLSIVEREQPQNEQDQTFHESVKAIAGARRGQLVHSVQKWITFHTELGMERLDLDEFPVMLSRSDRKFVAGWLEEDGFEVKRGRLNGRVTIVLVA